MNKAARTSPSKNREGGKALSPCQGYLSPRKGSRRACLFQPYTNRSTHLSASIHVEDIMCKSHLEFLEIAAGAVHLVRQKTILLPKFLLTRVARSEPGGTLQISFSIGPSGASALATALQHNSTLASLVLDSNSIGASGASALATILQHNSSLTALYLQTNLIGDSGARALATALRHNSTLTELDLRHNQIGASGLSALATAVQHNSTLTSLDLWGNKIGDQALSKRIKDKLKLNKSIPKRPMIAHASSSTHIPALLSCLARIRLSLPSTTIAASSSSSSSSKLEQSLPRLRSNDPSLTTLDLSANKIDASGASALATALQHNSTLTALDLKYNKLGDSGSGALMTTLHHNSTLITLDLKYNSIDTSGTKALAVALLHNSNLTTLVLYGNKIGTTGARALAAALHHNSTLTSLDLQVNKIGDSGASALATALQHNSTLTTLGLKNNSIDDHVLSKRIKDKLKLNKSIPKRPVIARASSSTRIPALPSSPAPIRAPIRAPSSSTRMAAASSFSSKLEQPLSRLRSNDPSFTTLDLNGKTIGDSGARVLATALQHNSTLTSLKLRGNQIGASGISALATALQHHPTLTNLNLNNNKIGDAGARVLAAALQHNSTLTTLNLYGNKVDDQALSKRIKDKLKLNKRSPKRPVIARVFEVARPSTFSASRTPSRSSAAPSIPKLTSLSKPVRSTLVPGRGAQPQRKAVSPRGHDLRLVEASTSHLMFSSSPQSGRTLPHLTEASCSEKGNVSTLAFSSPQGILPIPISEQHGSKLRRRAGRLPRGDADVPQKMKIKVSAHRISNSERQTRRLRSKPGKLRGAVNASQVSPHLLSLSKHARLRMQERGITLPELSLGLSSSPGSGKFITAPTRRLADGTMLVLTAFRGDTRPKSLRDRSAMHILTDFEEFLSRTSPPSPFKRSDEEIRKLSPVIEKAKIPKVFTKAGPSTPWHASDWLSDLDPRVHRPASVETRVTQFIQRHCRTIMETSTRNAYLLSSLKQAVSLYFGPPSALDFPQNLTKLSPEFSCQDGFLVRFSAETHPPKQSDRKKIDILWQELPASSKQGLKPTHPLKQCDKKKVIQQKRLPSSSKQGLKQRGGKKVVAQKKLPASSSQCSTPASSSPQVPPGPAKQRSRKKIVQQKKLPASSGQCLMPPCSTPASSSPQVPPGPAKTHPRKQRHRKKTAQQKKLPASSKQGLMPTCSSR